LELFVAIEICPDIGIIGQMQTLTNAERQRAYTVQSDHALQTIESHKQNQPKSNTANKNEAANERPQNKITVEE